MNSAPPAPQPLVDAILAARAGGPRASRTATPAPADRGAAYAAQATVARALQATAGGFKVGMLADGTPMSAPIFAADIRASGATWTLPHAGALTVEVELAFRLAHDLPARPSRAYSRAEVAAAVEAVLIGVEILQSRFDGDGFPPFALHLADNLGNAGYVVGASTRDFASRDLARLHCRCALDGVERHDAIGGHPQDDPWRPLIACLDEGAMALGGLRAGQVITTGTLLPPIVIDRALRLHASLEGIGSVDVAFAR
ncbi:MAG TPA: fumarylacetoacetate hydrolase family protein [Casimicrobiaceae bacterium]|jgi:2-keto-4-pentenoate hydratase